MNFPAWVSRGLHSVEHWVLLSGVMVWHHWERIAETRFIQYIKGEKKMEKDIALGTAGKLELIISGGKATISAQAAADGGALSVSASVVGDAGMLIDQLEAIVAKAVPATAPIDAAIFAAIKSAVMAIQ